MSLQVERSEKNMAKLTIEVSAEDFEKAVQKAYLKNKGKISIQGFRKGKAPRHLIEKMYGAEVFFEDAANDLIPQAYEDELAECDLEIVSQPKIDVVQIKKGEPFIFTAEVAVKPEVTLGEYKGLEVEVEDAAVTEEDVDKEIEEERDRNARTVAVEDRAAKLDDTVIIDFEGFVDGEAFEGGKGENYPLVLGSHSFIDNFEDQLVGVEIGAEVEVNVTFPKEYQAEELAGKKAMFKVKVNEIKTKELPDLDDDFAQDVSEFDTFAEYKEDVKKKLTERKEKEAKRAKEEAVIEKIIENAEMEIPEPMVEAQVRQMVEDFAGRIQQQGLTLEQYMQFSGMTPEQMLEQMRPNALKRIQSRLVLEAVVEAEKIEVPDEKVEQELADMAKMYQMEADKLKELMGEREMKQLKMDIAVQEAADLVTDSAK